MDSQIKEFVKHLSRTLTRVINFVIPANYGSVHPNASNTPALMGSLSIKNYGINEQIYFDCMQMRLRFTYMNQLDSIQTHKGRTKMNIKFNGSLNPYHFGRRNGYCRKLGYANGILCK